MIAGAISIVLLLVAAALLLEMRARGRLPTSVARRRLDAQLAELRRELAAVSVVDHSFVATQEDRVRQEWIRDRLTSTPVEALDVPGTGPATHKALRASGIATLEDLTKLGPYGVKVPSIGVKREGQLLGAFHDARRRLDEEARRLTRADLDAFSRGKLNATIARYEGEQLQRRRQEEGLRLRLRELERRRAAVP